MTFNPDLSQDPIRREGGVNFVVGNAFYRASSQVGRDLAVLAARIEKRDRGTLRVLDSMAGCGVRSLRYWHEGGADWVLANEGNPEVSAVLKHNLKPLLKAGAGLILHRDANRVFFQCYDRRDYYDLVDVDSFGSPVPFSSSSLWAVRLGGLVYLTSTDGRTATGHEREQSLRVYGATARSHPSAHEQALRLLIGTTQQQAARKGFGVAPVFSLFSGSVYRVMLRLQKGQQLSEQNYGFLGYCHGCGEYSTVRWRELGRVAPCPHDGTPPVLSGPMWLGTLHDRPYLRRMQAIARDLGWSDRAELLAVMDAEADLPPYFYRVGDIGRRSKADLLPRDVLIQRLRDCGYRATATHLDAQAIKTDADLRTCAAIVARG